MEMYSPVPPHEAPNSILRLSNEILGIIIQYMDTRTLKHFGSANIRCREVAETELWKSMTIIFQQLPLLRTTRLRIERTKTVNFCSFCRDPMNARLLSRIQVLRLSVPLDVVDNASGTRFESDVRWFVDNVSNLFPNLHFMEIYSQAEELPTRAVINGLLSIPVPKKVELTYPLNASTFPPVDGLSMCEELIVSYPVSVDIDRLLPLNLIKDVKRLDLSCESYQDVIALDPYKMANTIGKSTSLEYLSISRGTMIGANSANWVPPSLRELCLKDVLFEEVIGVPPIHSQIRTLTLTKTGEPGVAGHSVLKAVEMPNLQYLITNGNCHALYGDLPESLEHITMTGPIERALSCLNTTRVKSFEFFLGKTDEFPMSRISRIAHACSLSLERFGLCVIPPFEFNHNTFGQTATSSSSYKQFIAIVKIFVQTCPKLHDNFYLIDPEGLEYWGLKEGWLTQCDDTSHLGKFDKRHWKRQFKVDTVWFKEMHTPQSNISSSQGTMSSSMTTSSAQGSITISY